MTPPGYRFSELESHDFKIAMSSMWMKVRTW
jgi:hypothetical protein